MFVKEKTKIDAIIVGGGDGSSSKNSNIYASYFGRIFEDEPNPHCRL